MLLFKEGAPETSVVKNNKSPLKEIVAELDHTRPIERSTVFRWMQTADIEAMGALMSLLTDRRHRERVQPPLVLDEYYNFMANYYERCLSENPDGEWSDSRTTCGWDFAKWFLQLWDDEFVPRRIVADLKDRLATLCRHGGTGLCKALVTAVLEHLFRRPAIKDYFGDWADDLVLRIAYDEAALLADAKARSKH